MRHAIQTATLFPLLLALAAGPGDAAEKTNTVDSVGGSGYVMNGATRPELTLVRGHSYLFQASAAPSFHPLKLSTSATGGGGTSIFTNKVTGPQPCCGSGCSATSFVFAPDSTTPDLLYYQCNVHQNLGNKVHIVNPPAFSGFTETNGLIGLTFASAYSTTASVQRATDLFSNDWLTVQTLTSTPGSISTTISNTSATEFYRILTPLP